MAADELAGYRRAVNPARLGLIELYGSPLHYPRVQGAWVWDRAGQKHLDFIAGYGTALLGHRHPKVMQALAEALLTETRPFTHPLTVAPVAGTLATQLCKVAGHGLTKVYFGNSGSEGIEAALKFAMATTGRGEFVAFDRAYHGMTLGALPLSGADYMQAPFPAAGVKAHRVAFGDVVGVEAILQKGNIAGVVLEPIQGMGGGRTWSLVDLKQLAALCKQYGALLILDEVLSGLGRVGRWFAFQVAGVDFAPDIVVASKTLTGGAVPMCAVLMTERVYTAVYTGLGRANIHTSTFEANLLAMTAGLAVLDVIESENLLARAADIQAQFRQRSAHLRQQYGLIGDVRGDGVWVSLDVSDDFDREQEIWGAPALQQRLRQQGVLVNLAAQAPQTLNLLPPLTVTDEEVDTFFAALTAVLKGSA